MFDSLLLDLASRLDESTRDLIDRDPFETFGDRYWDDPVAFAQDCIAWPKGSNLFPYQARLLDLIPKYRRVTARGPHGLGKTAIASITLLWFALTRESRRIDWKVISTASAWRQLERYLWPEIHLWARRLKWDVIGRRPFDERNELSTLQLRMRYGQAFAVASDQPETIEGGHASQILWLLDEAKIIPRPFWESVEGAMSTGEAYCVAYSTPGDPSGVFYDIHQRKAGYEDWFVVHVSLEEAIESGRISRDWADQRRKQWGEDSPAYITRVLGDFATEGTAGVIPLSWVETAIERWNEWNDAGRPGIVSAYGADIGGGSVDGDDSVVATIVDGQVVAEARVFQSKEPTQATMELIGQLGGLMTQSGAPAFIDVIGIGAGVAQRLRERRLPAYSFNSSKRTGMLDFSGQIGFLNWRSAAWWLGREMLDPNSGLRVALPDDDELIGELTAPNYTINSNSQYVIEDKYTLRRKIGRSTNKADAVLMGLIGPLLVEEELAGEGQPEVRYFSTKIGDW